MLAVFEVCLPTEDWINLDRWHIIAIEIEPQQELRIAANHKPLCDFLKAKYPGRKFLLKYITLDHEPAEKYYLIVFGPQWDSFLPLTNDTAVVSLDRRFIHALQHDPTV